MDGTAKERGGVGLVLFALPFAAFGVAVTCWTAWTLWQAAAAHSWVETPARILEAQLAKHRDDDGTTYRAEATYEYEFGGRLYRGTRVSLYSGYDNIGSFQQDAYRELSRYVRPRAAEEAASSLVELDGLAEEEPLFRCYVNPDRPGEAVLYRGLRFGMVLLQTTFALLFSGMGFGLIVGQLGSRAAEKKKEALAAAAPEQPRKWRADWASGVIRADRATAVVGVVLAGAWNLLCLTIGVGVFPALAQAVSEGELLWLVFLLFPAVGVVLAVVAVREMARLILFGDATLELVTVPCVTGGTLAGIIRLPRKVRAADGFVLKLRCLATVRSGDGVKREELWAHGKTVAFDVEADSSRTAIPVQFDVPGDQPETDPGGNRPVEWRLELSASNPGIDLAVRFEVPVFKAATARTARTWRRAGGSRARRIPGLEHEP